MPKGPACFQPDVGRKHLLHLALRRRASLAAKGKKKADAVECTKAFHRVGILVAGSPDSAGLPFS